MISESHSEDNPDCLPLTMVRSSTPTLEDGRPVDGVNDRTGLLVSDTISHRPRSSRRGREAWKNGQKKVATGARLCVVWLLIIFIVALFALVGLRDGIFLCD
jgi:hypothetical protein